MFESSNIIARRWTFPVFVFTRFRDGRITSSIGTGFLVNDEGCFLTAAHVIKDYPIHVDRIRKLETREADEKAIREQDLPRNEEQKKLRALGGLGKDDPTNVCLYVWHDRYEVESLAIDPYGDIALGRIRDFKPLVENQEYPVFARFDDIVDPAGKSLCTLGHAFPQFAATWDKQAAKFKLPAETLPVPIFPMNSILTRGVNASVVNLDDNTVHERRFIELSSPGLKGQSGGPVFDVNGTVMGLQSRTISHESGFNTKETQYIHLGLAVHPSSICNFLDESDTKYRSN